MTLLVTDPLYLEHQAPGHVECPERVEAILAHFRKTGLLRRLTALPARDATPQEIALIHHPAYVEIVREASARGGGWFDADTYLNERSYDAAVRAVGGVLAAVEAVRDGRDRTAFCLVRPPGHHATPERGMGFCLFNNVAIAARFLKRRVLIVDWDVHHGNGTQDAFENDPTIWYLSTHRFPFYPGTGDSGERGAGNIINLPLDIDTPREALLKAFDRAVRKAAREFRPEFLLVSCGFDAYEDDPIGGLNLKPEDYRTMTDVVCSLGIPVVSALEGGYSLTGLGPCAEQHAEGLLAVRSPKEGDPMHPVAATLILLSAVLAPQAKPNPQYEYWADCKPGSWVKNRMEIEGQGQKIEYESITRLLEVTPEKVVLETLMKMKTADKTIDTPPRRSEIKAADPQNGQTVSEKDDEITVAGKTLKCRYYEVVTEAAEKKPKTTVKAWMTKDIPGGAAKSEVTSEQMKGPIRTTAMEWEKK